MLKIKTALFSTILFVLGAMLVCFGALAMPTKQTLAAELATQADAATGQTATTQKDDGSTELNAGEGVAYIQQFWTSGIVINGAEAGSQDGLCQVTSITFHYQTDLSGITGDNIGTTGATSIGDTLGTIIASVNGTDITIYSSQPTVAFPEICQDLFSFYKVENGTGISNLKSIDWGNVIIDTSNVTEMNYMFQYLVSLTELDLSGWDTSNVTEMRMMFYMSSSLKKIKGIENWDVSKLEDCHSMFSGCYSFTELDVSKWDIGSAKDISYMFSFCNNISSLDVGNWDTSNVSDMRSVFAGCASLKSLDLTKWNTSKVTNMSGMFKECVNLTSLDLSSWDVSKVTNMSKMFGINEMYTESGKVSSVYLAQQVNSMAGQTLFTGLEENFYSDAFDVFMGAETGYTNEQAKAAIEKQYGVTIEQAELATMKLKPLNLRGWTIGSSVTTTDMFSGLNDAMTLVAPATCEQTIALPVKMYDGAGNEYTSLSSATSNKVLTGSLPAAGFDGLELIATTSVGLVALIAVGYALISNKKKKESKFSI